MQSSTLPSSRRSNERHYDGKGGILEDVKTNGKRPYPERPPQVAGPTEPDTAKLARSIAAYAPQDGTFDLRIPGLHVSRFSRTNMGCVHALQLPALCIIAQAASSAGQRMGYLSASQFSREYSRFFGSAPTRDMAKLRQYIRPWVSPS